MFESCLFALKSSQLPEHEEGLFKHLVYDFIFIGHLVLNFLGTPYNNCWSRKILVQKNFGSLTLSDMKKFGPQKILGPEKFGSREFGVQKNFGS